MFSDKEVDLKIRDQALRAMELNLGASNVFLIDNIFDGSNLLGNLFKPVSAFIIFTSAKSSVSGSIFTYIDNDGAKREVNFLVSELYYSDGEILNEAKRLNDKTLRVTLSKVCLRLALDLLSNEKV